MDHRMQNGTHGGQDSSHDQVFSPSGGVSIQAAPAVEPENHDRRSHGLPRISEAATPSPAEYQTLFRKALQEPNSLTPDDIEVLVASICQSAICKVNYAMPGAEFCVAVMERCERTQHDLGEMFLENVLLFCCELFNSRDHILRPPDQPTNGARHWGSYVIFLAELLDGLNEAENTAGPSRSGGAHAAKARCMMVLATLICASCRTMLQPPSSYMPSEMDCLRTALITAGAALEHEAPEQLAALMRDVQAALETQRLPIHSQHVLQKLLEPKASGWQMNESEKAYGSPTSR